MTMDKITIDNQEFYSVKQFAFMTSHGEASINQLITKGNKFRKLKTKRFPAISMKPLIFASELTEFIFAQSGPKLSGGVNRGYKYLENGEQIELIIDSKGKIQEQ